MNKKIQEMENETLILKWNHISSCELYQNDQLYMIELYHRITVSGHVLININQFHSFTIY